MVGLFARISVSLHAQDVQMPLNAPAYPMVERIVMRDPGTATIHTALKPYWRGDVFRMAVKSAGDSAVLLADDRSYLLADNDEFFSMSAYHHGDTTLQMPQSRSALLGIFYRTPAHLYALDTRDFYLRVSPVLHFALGRESGRDHLVYINRRGVELRGGIDEKVFFSTNIIESQLRPAAYIRDFTEEFSALPDAGLYKTFEGDFFKGEGGYDYLASNGYVGFHVTRHIGVQLGHGKNFIGDGYRSLFLSDFAKNYFYLRLNTRVWKFHYQNLFAELNAREKLPGNVVVPKKYVAAHYLSFKAHPRFTLGLYEAVVFAREANRFELQYLNPVILYRSVEHHVGSPDNILVGISARWDVAQQVAVYGQFVLDEFKFTEFLSERKWWGNKHGLQLGVKYLDVLGVRNFDAQVEYNQVRPFTYSHYDSLGSYAHFNQALAHPLGANFNEVLFKLDYRPVPRLWLTAKYFLIRAGADTDETYFGTNILRPNTERNAEFGIAQRQGVSVRNTILSLNARYMIRHNVFLEATYFRRDFDSADNTRDLFTQYASLGVRWNFFPFQDEF